MGDYYSFVKTNLVDAIQGPLWMDVGNSSYCTWTEIDTYPAMAHFLLAATTGHPASPYITYVTLIHANPTPTNYSAQFVQDYIVILLQDPNVNVAAVMNIAHTEGAPNAH
jgi:hypothetical protein